MNTAKKGRVRHLVFKEDDTWYGVALEFNIVEEGDDPDVVFANLQEAIRGYVEAQRKLKGTRYAPLNQTPVKEYEDLWNKVQANKAIPSPYQVSSAGYSLV